jgi:outer membrane protein TolC
MLSHPRSLAGLGSLPLLALLVLCPGAARAERKLSLAEATRLALAQNPELRLEDAKVTEAEARQKSTGSNWGPKLLLDANLLVWNDSQKFELAMPTMEDIATKLKPTDLATLVKYSDLLALMPYLFDLGNIREQVTAQIQLTLAQPLTPLLQVREGHKATRMLTEATTLDRQTKREEIVYKVKEGYLKLMQVQRLAEVAQTGVDQVSEHLKRARQFQAAGLIGKQEVLKAQVELARARERVIKARYGISLSSSALGMLLGLPLEERIVPTEKVVDPPPSRSGELGALMRQAGEQRAELKSMEKKREAALADEKRTRYDLVPQLSAIATYQHTEGQGTLMPKNSFFFGGILKWEVWDWGGKYYAAKAARARVAQAELGQRLLREGVALQTKKAFLDLEQSREELEVARTVIAEAEEAYRIEQKRFAANANTSTDVLDAQLSLTRANLSYTTALYGYYIARAALERAVGERR